MRTSDVVAILTAFLPYVMAVPAILAAWAAFRSASYASAAHKLGEKNSETLAKQDIVLDKVQLQTDGIQTALMKASVGQAKLQGREEIRQEQGIGAGERLPIDVAIVQPIDDPVPVDVHIKKGSS